MSPIKGACGHMRYTSIHLLLGSPVASSLDASGKSCAILSVDALSLHLRLRVLPQGAAKINGLAFACFLL